MYGFFEPKFYNAQQGEEITTDFLPTHDESQRMQIDETNAATKRQHQEIVDASNDRSKCPRLNTPAETTSVQTSKKSCIQDGNRCLKKYAIGFGVYISVQIFRGQLSVHIRKYVENEDKHVIPTKEGICVTLQTWFELTTKIFDVSLVYTSDSVILNNSVLAFVRNSKLFLQQYSSFGNLPSIELNLSQFDSLKQCLDSVNSYIISQQFCIRLPYFISQDIPKTSDMDKTYAMLRDMVKEELSSVMCGVYRCLGCIFYSAGQASHTCMTISDTEKFAIVGSEARLLINIDTIAVAFHSQKLTLSKHMVFSNLCNDLF